MGSGKSSVARQLARNLGCEFVDLDQTIRRTEGRTPGQIIAVDGEKNFRELETRQLRKVLGVNNAQVVALGGGTWMSQINRELIVASNALTIWLDAPFDLCWQRIDTSNEIRPLARSREQSEKLFNERRASYSLADIKVTVLASDTADSIAATIVTAIDEHAG
jgi:shikimate kinase